MFTLERIESFVSRWCILRARGEGDDVTRVICRRQTFVLQRKETSFPTPDADEHLAQANEAESSPSIYRIYQFYRFDHLKRLIFPPEQRNN